MVINIDTMVPEFAKYPIDLQNLLFNSNKMYDSDNYKSILKPDEDKDAQGNKGLYSMNPNFQVIVLSNISDPDIDFKIIPMVLDVLPCSEKFAKIYVTD